jgi:hypothetical protein
MCVKLGDFERFAIVVMACAVLLSGPSVLASPPGGAAGPVDPAKIARELNRAFDLAGNRATEVHYFRMETQFVHIGFDGKRTGVETYVLKLKCVPGQVAGKSGDVYTCREVLVKLGDNAPQSVPALRDWTYVYAPLAGGRDEKGQVLGIPHAKFENLMGSDGRKLPVSVGYFVYNNFVDFHSFNDVFARPAAGGRGIQDLKAVGQKIVHASAFSEPPVNLGAGIKEGSVFRNGEVTLELKGVGLVDGEACAIVGYDSGESTLKMITPLGPGQDVETVGGSEYKGDIWIDLRTRWVRKVTMDEFVVTETRLPAPAPKVTGYTVRHLLMRMTSQAEFEQGQTAGK